MGSIAMPNGDYGHSSSIAARNITRAVEGQSASDRVPLEWASGVPIRDLPSILVAMCNDYEQHVAWAEYCKMMQKLELGVPTQQSELDLPHADDIRVSDVGG